MEESSPEQFSPHDLVPILTAVRIEDDAFVVGGQAFNLWAERYRHCSPELRDAAPYTSKDLDYFGRRELGVKLAAILGGEVIFPDMDEATPSTAMVRASVNGRTILIDILGSILGQTERLEREAVEIVFKTSAGDVIVPVMDPVSCLQSQIGNWLSPATSRRDAIQKARISAAVVIAREYIRELFSKGSRRDAARCIKDVLWYARRDHFGKTAYLDTPSDPLDAIRCFVDDANLDERYRLFIQNRIDRIGMFRTGLSERRKQLMQRLKQETIQR